MAFRTQQLARPAETSAASARRHSAFLQPIRPILPAHTTLGGSQPKRSPHRRLASVRGRRPTLSSGRERSSRSERSSNKRSPRHVLFSRTNWGFLAFLAAIKKGPPSKSNLADRGRPRQTERE